MPDIVVTQAYQLAVLTEVDATVLLDATVALSSTNIIPEPTTPIGSYTLADYTGYAPGDITPQDPSVSDNGTPEIVYPLTPFRPTGSTVGNLIFCALLIADGGALLGACRLDTDSGIPMQSALDVLQLTLRVRLSPDGSIVVQIT